MNYLSGIKTQLSSLVVTFMIGATLLWLTNLFYYTPSCVLAAIVISAALSLIDVAEPIYLIRVREFIDLFCYCVVVIITLLLGPGKKLARFYSTLHYTTLHNPQTLTTPTTIEIGVAAAVVLSLVLVVYQSARPNFVRLGQLPGTTVYKDIKRFPNASQIDGILLLRYIIILFIIYLLFIYIFISLGSIPICILQMYHGSANCLTNTNSRALPP